MAPTECGGQPTNRDFSGWAFGYAELASLDLAGAVFNRATLNGVSFPDTSLVGASFVGIEGNARFSGAVLDRARFEGDEVRLYFSPDIEGGPDDEVRLAAASLIGTTFRIGKVATSQFYDERLAERFSPEEAVADLSEAVFSNIWVECSAEHERETIAEWTDEVEADFQRLDGVYGRLFDALEENAYGTPDHKAARRVLYGDRNDLTPEADEYRSLRWDRRFYEEAISTVAAEDLILAALSKHDTLVFGETCPNGGSRPLGEVVGGE